jgi:hypothetical protein
MTGWLSPLYDDGEPIDVRNVAKRAGIVLTLSQIPGFIITRTVFTSPNAFAFRQDRFFDSGVFPLGGLGLFVILCYLLSSGAWEWQMERRAVKTSEQAVKFGWLLGAGVHVIVWGTGLISSGLAASGLGILVEVGSMVVFTYAIGWTTSLGAAGGCWSLETLRTRSIQTSYEKTKDERLVTHVCSFCGQEHTVGPTVEIDNCRVCGGNKVKRRSPETEES